MLSTPDRPSVRCIILNDDNKCLTVTRPVRVGASDPGKQEFPGGMALPGEDLATAGARETAEETGLRVEIISEAFDLGEFTVQGGKRQGRSYEAVGFLAKVIGGVVGTGSEQLPVSWTPLEQIPGNPTFVDVSRVAASIVCQRLATM